MSNCLPSMRSSEGRWKWNCASSKRRPITSIELPGATFTCTVWPLSSTPKALGL